MDKGSANDVSEVEEANNNLNKTFYVHSLILTKDALVLAGMSRFDKSPLILPDVSPRAFKVVLCYIWIQH